MPVTTMAWLNGSVEAWRVFEKFLDQSRVICPPKFLFMRERDMRGI
ncbi:hypothetical protein KPK_B0031 (plasmid) [Klebsiella variicola]|uniref:Uncharacterized protein n=1 Tax=Klebsiella variicola (strain 342) TaxID=507522 RepID=B5RKJ0_KLEV3|nr:hypothetical protein KPK_B0031 [Klebsiella variicola]